MVPLPERFNLGVLLDENLERGRADKPAIYTEREQVTYGELYRRVCQLAHALRALGIRREERVLLILDDTPAFATALFAAMRLAAIPIPVNTYLRAKDYRFFLEDSYARAVIVERDRYEEVRRAVAGLAEPVAVITANGRVDGAYALEDLIGPGHEPFPPVSTHREDPAYWQYSSGSTGRPKCVVHLHRTAHYGLVVTQRAVEFTGSDVTFSAAKLFHSFGMAVNLLLPVLAGASSVMLAGRLVPQAVLQTIDRFRPTLFFAAPTLYYKLLQQLERTPYDLSSVRLFVSGGEALPLELWRRWQARGYYLMDEIGSTELGCTYLANLPGAFKPGSLGKPLPGVEAKLVDEHGAPVGPGQVGELYVKSPSRFAYYRHDLEKTARAFYGEWYRTGDCYRMDEDGFFYYEGRADDMIKVSGLWVSPVQIENALMGHPEVGEAAVVGVRVDGTLNRIKAYVTLRSGGEPAPDLARRLQAWCKERLLPHQYPHIIEFVPELPRTETGKTQRGRLRQQVGAQRA